MRYLVGKEIVGVCSYNWYWKIFYTYNKHTYSSERISCMQAKGKNRPLYKSTKNYNNFFGAWMFDLSLLNHLYIDTRSDIFWFSLNVRMFLRIILLFSFTIKDKTQAEGTF